MKMLLMLLVSLNLYAAESGAKDGSKPLEPPAPVAEMPSARGATTGCRPETGAERSQRLGAQSARQTTDEAAVPTGSNQCPAGQVQSVEFSTNK